MVATTSHIFSGKVDIASNLKVGSSHLFVDTENNRVGITTTDPRASLHVNGNVYAATNVTVGTDLTVAGRVITSGNVEASSFIGDGSQLTSLASNLQQVTENGNVTSNTIRFTNADTSLIASGNVTVSGNVTSSISIVSNVATIGTTKTFVVTIGGNNKYYIDGVDRPSLELHQGQTYIFDMSHGSNSGHPLAFSTAFNGSSGSYTTGVVSNHSTVATGTTGSKVTFSVPLDAPSSIYYYCTFHGAGMGSSTASSISPTAELVVSGRVVTSGNVEASSFIGDGSLLTGLASNLQQVTENGNVTSNTVQFTNATTGLVSTGNVHALKFIGDGSLLTGLASNLQQVTENGNVTSNTVQFTNATTGLVATGNVHALKFIGDGSLLTGLASNLQQVTENGNVTSNTVQFTNATTGLVATGNVHALKFIGDGSLLTGLASNLQQVTENGNVTSNTVQFTNATTSLVATGNVHALKFIGDGSQLTGLASNLQQVTENGNVTSNTVQFTNATTGLVATGNVHALKFIGDGSQLTGLASNLQQVTENGNVTSNTVQFTNATTGFITTGNVGVSNANPGHDLSVGSNLYVDDTGSNVLVISGSAAMTALTLGEVSIVSSHGLNDVLNVSNISSNTMQLINATTALVTTGNVSVGSDLTISGNAVVSSNLTVTGNAVVSSNLTVTGNVETQGKFIGDGSSLTGMSSNLQVITDFGNVTSNTIQFTNATTGIVATGNVSIGGELTMTGTGALTVPVGTTAQRPSEAVGMLRYNSTTGFMEAYSAVGWAPIAQPPTVTGISPLTTLSSGGQAAGYNDVTAMPQPPNANNGDKLGWSVSVSGNGMYALAGAAYDTSDRGALHIYVRNASTNAWTHQQELTIPNIATDDFWGYTQQAVSLSNDGTYAVAGSQYHDSQTGRAIVWFRNGTSWSYQQELTFGSMPTGAYFGSGVDISTDGNYIIIGAYSDDVLRSGAGAAHIFIRSGTTWSHQATLPRTGDGNSGNAFGSSVGISSDGTYAIVGSPAAVAPFPGGSAHLYIRSGTTWTHQKLMVDPNGQGGDYFGYGVHISGDGNYAAIGSPYDTSSTGAGHIFVRNGTSWTRQQQITITSAAATDYGFEQLKLTDDGTILVGSVRYRRTGGIPYGSLVIFTRSGTNWTQTKEIHGYELPNPVSDDNFGHCSDISSDGTMIVSGAYGRDTGGTNRGAMYSIPLLTEIIDASNQVFTATGTGIVSGSTVQLEGADGSLYSVVDATAPNAAGTQVTFKMGGIETVEFPPSAMSTNTSITGYVASSSGNYNANAYRAFDDVVTTSNYWPAGNASLAGGYDTNAPYLAGSSVPTTDIHHGHWLQLQIPSPVILTRAVISSTQSGYQHGQFVILGSNDGTNWTLLHAGTGVNGVTSTNVTTLSAGSTKAFSYFRVVIKSKTSSASNYNIELNNVQFFGKSGSWALAQQPYKVKINSTSGLNGTSTAKIGFPVTWTTAAGANLEFSTGESITKTLAGTDGGGGSSRTFSVAPGSNALPSPLSLTDAGVINGTIAAVGTTSVTFRLTDNATELFTDRAINIVGLDSLFAFTTHTFTNAAATGRFGPTFAQMKTAYASAIWEQDTAFFNEISGKQGFQLWTIPKTGSYTIKAYGANGTSYTNGGASTTSGGARAWTQGTFSLTQGQKLTIIVGQLAGWTANNNSACAGGGGGASWVLKEDYGGSGATPASLYLVAGGGGGRAGSNGAGWTSVSNAGQSQAALVTPPGTASLTSGEGFNAGGGASYGINGGGVGTPGPSGGKNPYNGAAGGNYGYNSSSYNNIGGFGGGGGSGAHAGGGGGGYVGGRASTSYDQSSGYGGSSRNNGSSVTFGIGGGNNHGQVIITLN